MGEPKEVWHDRVWAARPLTVVEDTPKIISGGASSFTVSDADAGTQNIEVTLSVLHGVLDVKTVVEDGCLLLPSGPGLGVGIAPGVVERWAM